MKLLNGDCLIELNSIEDSSVDLILADLPYGTTQAKWDSIIPMNQLWPQYKRVIKPNGAIVLFSNEPFTSNLILSNVADYRYKWIWVKPNATTPSLAKIQPMRRFEEIVVFYKKQPTYNPQMEEGKPYKWNSKRSGGEITGIKYKEDTPIDNKGTRYPTNILEFNQERGLHPTQKPVELLRYLIRTYTNPGEIVLDNTMGSGSTGVAAALESREFIGIELDTQYFDIATQRIKEVWNETN